MMRIKLSPYQMCATMFILMYLFMVYSGWSLQRKVRLLGSSDRRLRFEARRDLMAAGTGAVSLIVTGLWDANPKVRKESASLLGTIGDARAISALRQSLKDPDSHS